MKQPSYKVGLVFPSGTNRTMACVRCKSMRRIYRGCRCFSVERIACDVDKTNQLTGTVYVAIPR